VKPLSHIKGCAQNEMFENRELRRIFGPNRNEKQEAGETA
jgi:hypothetical protein